MEDYGSRHEGDSEDSEYETFDAPLSALGDVEAGTTKTVKVVSVDEDTGMATLQCDHPKEESDEGISKMSKAFRHEE